MITTLLETVGEERKADLRDKIASALIDDSVSEYSVALPTKRRRTDQNRLVTERFNLGKSPAKNFLDYDKSPSTGFTHTPSMVDITPVDHGARRMSWSRLIFEKQGSTP